MKKTAYLLVLILLTLVAGCDLFKPDDNDPDDGWIDIASFDFPMYMGHFADYEHTDANGNHLGSVTFGEGGADSDWQVFEYDPSDKALESLQWPIPIPEPKDPYYICVKAYYGDTNEELPATILLNGSSTSYSTPYTFTHTGNYDPSLEDQYEVYCLDYCFNSEPEVTFNPDTNTYTYSFDSIPYIIPPFGGFNIVTEQGQVVLTWITVWETQMAGYRLYRSISNDISIATEITPELIPATNTNLLHTYTFTDSAVELGNTYYYWLEFVFIEDPSSFYGPVSITTPPAVNAVDYAYPNPCQDSFYLDIDVKVGTTATVVLLDSENTIRKTYLLEEGYQQLQMDVSNLEPELYRTFIWFSDGHYAYGDVLIQD